MNLWAAISRPFSNLYEIFKITIYDNHIRNPLPDDGKRKKAVVQQTIAMPYTQPYGGFEKIKAAVPYALDKGVTTTR